MKTKIFISSLIFLLINNFLSVKAEETTISTLSVNGFGESKAKPDIATLNITSSAKGKTANEATRLNSIATEKLIDTLIKLSVNENDIQTTNVSVFPIFRPTKPGENDFDDINKILGYEASNSVLVTIRNINNVGQIIDAVSVAGNYIVSGVNFGLDKDDSFEADALKKAVADAKRKADVVAAAAGKAIIGIKNISVGGGENKIFAGGFADTASATPIQPGELTITESVSIQYIIEK